MSYGDAVWERSAENYFADNVMSKRWFITMVCFWTTAGIGSSAWAATVSLHWQPTWALFLGVLVVSILGILIALKSENPLISLIGYAMITIPFGLMFGPVVALYTKASVFSILAVTTGLVVVLGFIGAIIPQSLESWGIYLFGGLVMLLLGLIAVPIAGMFGLPITKALTWMDWIGVVLFSGYVIFDLNRAMRVERTHDNAIDCAVAIYLDFANLFIRLLQLFGKKSSND